MWLFDRSQSVTQVIGSFLFFQWFTVYLSPQFFQNFSFYNSLTSEKKDEWNARSCSTMHAIMISLSSLYIITYDEETVKNTLWGDSWMGKSNIAFATGYLLYDLGAMIMDFESTGGTAGYFGHHVSALYAYSYVLYYGVLVYFANFRLLAEISTPFVNLRWFFDVTGNRESKQYFYNGLILTAAFFSCRIACMPYYYSQVFATFGTSDFDRLGFIIQASWIVSCVVLDILNVVWFMKIVKGALKVLYSKAQVKKQKVDVTETEIEESSSTFNNNSWKHSPQISGTSLNEKHM